MERLFMGKDMDWELWLIHFKFPNLFYQSVRNYNQKLTIVSPFFIDSKVFFAQINFHLLLCTSMKQILHIHHPHFLPEGKLR